MSECRVQGMGFSFVFLSVSESRAYAIKKTLNPKSQTLHPKPQEELQSISPDRDWLQVESRLVAVRAAL